MNLSTITTALYNQLNSDAGVLSLQATIINGGYANMDPNQTPWIGVYRGRTVYSPRTLGIDNFEAQPSLKVMVQASSLLSGDDCSTKLDEYVNKVMSAIRGDTTIGGTVDMVNGFEVEYMFNETDKVSLHFQAAIINIELEVLDP